MVHSGTKGPTRPTTQTSLRAHRKPRGNALNRPQIPATKAHFELDWDHFRDLYYPDTRRHNLEAIVAYGDYTRTLRPHAGSDSVLFNDVVSADADSLGAWEDEGGWSRDPSIGGASDDQRSYAGVDR